MTVQSRRLTSVAALALLAGIAVIVLTTEPAAASGPLRTHAASKGKFIGLAAATGPLANEAAYRTIAADRVQPDHRRKRDEVGRHRAAGQQLHLRRRRPDRRLRPGQQPGRARAHPGLAQPDPGLGAGPVAPPRCAPPCRTTSPRVVGRYASNPAVRVLGRRQRGLQRERHLPPQLLVQHARPGLHRRRVPLRPRRRPRCAPVHQRLQRRGHQRQEHRDVQPGPVAAIAGRTGRLRRFPGAPGRAVRLPERQLQQNIAAIRRARRAGAHHRAGRAHPAARRRDRDSHAEHATTRNVSTPAWRSPACAGVTIWGFTDRHSWVPGHLPRRGPGAASTTPTTTRSPPTPRCTTPWRRAEAEDPPSTS